MDEPVVDVWGWLDVPAVHDGVMDLGDVERERDGDGRRALEVGAVHRRFDPVVVFGAEVAARHLCCWTLRTVVSGVWLSIDRVGVVVKVG